MATEYSGQLGLELGAPVAEKIGESGRVHRPAANYVLGRFLGGFPPGRVKRHFFGSFRFRVGDFVVSSCRRGCGFSPFSTRDLQLGFPGRQKRAFRELSLRPELGFHVGGFYNLPGFVVGGGLLRMRGFLLVGLVVADQLLLEPGQPRNQP